MSDAAGVRPRLSVIVPVYNEEKTVAEILRRVLGVEIDLEVVAVDDASTDGTAEVLRAFAFDPRVRLLRHEANRGKGAAIRTAVPHCRGAAITIQDGDLEYDPNDLPRLLEPIERGEAAVVYGSRYLGTGASVRSYWRYYLGGRLLSHVANLLYGTQITDEPTCYKVFRADVLQGMPLACERFEFCPEVTAKAARAGHRILELPISYNPRKLEEGKKIRWTDGVQAVWTLVKYRFVR